MISLQLYATQAIIAKGETLTLAYYDFMNKHINITGDPLLLLATTVDNNEVRLGLRLNVIKVFVGAN